PYQAPTYALIDHPPATTVIDVVCQPLPRSLIVTSHRRHIRPSGPGRVEEALQGYFSTRRVAPVSLSHCSLLEFSNNSHSSCLSVAQLHRRHFHHSKNAE